MKRIVGSYVTEASGFRSSHIYALLLTNYLKQFFTAEIIKRNLIAGKKCEKVKNLIEVARIQLKEFQDWSITF